MLKKHTISILSISFFILTSFNALAMTESEKLDLCQDMLRDYQSEVTGPNITPQQASMVKEVYEIGFKELGCAQVGVSLKPPGKHCSQEDLKNNAYWEVDGEALYQFTSKIIDAVRDRNLDALVSYIKDELAYGPRKRYLVGKKFSDVFSENFRQSILQSGPTCLVHSWRGVILGNGEIWIQYDSPTEFYIYSITDWKEEEFNTSNMAIQWVVDGKLLTPDCFPHIWASGDNYEHLAEEYSIDLSDLGEMPGKYLGKIPLETPYPWNCPKGETCQPLSLVAKIKNCGAKLPAPTVKGRENRYEILEDDYTVQYLYELLDSLSPNVCASLAPNFTAKSLGGFLVRFGDYSGGTAGWDMHYNAYGLFQLPNGEKVLAPLACFSSENEARNFVEDLKLGKI